MEGLNQEETVILTACGNCAAEMYESARFCRSCGAPRFNFRVVGSKDSRALTTRSLNARERYRPISGPLIDAVGAGFGTSPALQLKSGLTRNLLLALISIPLWLLIILLSPVDAYLAARAIASNH